MKDFFCGNMGHIWCFPCMTQPQERAIKYVLSLQDQAAHSVPQMSYTSCEGEVFFWCDEKSHLPASPFWLGCPKSNNLCLVTNMGIFKIPESQSDTQLGVQQPRDSLEQPWGEFHGWHFPAGGFGAGAKGTLSWEGKTVVRKNGSKSISLSGLRIRSFQWACTLMWYKQYHSQPIGDGSEQSHFW